MIHNANSKTEHKDTAELLVGEEVKIHELFN
jgi:hypothetical protein